MGEQLVATLVYPTGAVVRVYAAKDDADVGELYRRVMEAFGSADMSIPMVLAGGYRVEPVAPAADPFVAVRPPTAAEAESLRLITAQLETVSKPFVAPAGVTVSAPGADAEPACTCPDPAGHAAGCAWAAWKRGRGA